MTDQIFEPGTQLHQEAGFAPEDIVKTVMKVRVEFSSLTFTKTYSIKLKLPFCDGFRWRGVFFIKQKYTKNPVLQSSLFCTVPSLIPATLDKDTNVVTIKSHFYFYGNVVTEKYTKNSLYHANPVE